jgi:hypothetical protein
LDSGGPDAPDGRSDVSNDVLDAAIDQEAGPVDANNDTPNDAADAGPPLTIEEYQHAIGVAWCERAAECCQLDASHFDRDKCIALRDGDTGPERVSVYLLKYKLAGAGFPPTLTFARTQAAQCIALQRNRGCEEDGAEKRNIYNACMGAVQGAAKLNEPCTQSIECISGHYCASPGDGGPGVCTALVAQDAICQDPNVNSDQCTWLGIHASTTLHCETGGDGPSTCEPGKQIGETCRFDQQCASGVCSTTSQACAVSQVYVPANVCTFLTKTPLPDAGGG